MNERSNFRNREKDHVYSAAELKKFINSMTDEEVDKAVYSTDLEQPEQPQVVETIIRLAREIRDYDSGFENKHSERERAEATAKKVYEKYVQICCLIPGVPVEWAHVVQEGLRVMDHYYMRVFGDRMEYFKVNCEYFDLENKVKCLWYESVPLRVKLKRRVLLEMAKKKKLSRDYDITADRIMSSY